MDKPLIMYSQYWGRIFLNGKEVGAGYSGSGAAVNNPSMEATPDIGPIPRGMWRILRWYTDPHLGPTCAELVPMGHDAHGRSGFRIHGDNPLLTHSASHGCIVAPKDVRDILLKSGVLDLEVTQ